MCQGFRETFPPSETLPRARRQREINGFTDIFLLKTLRFFTFPPFLCIIWDEGRRRGEIRRTNRPKEDFGWNSRGNAP